MQWHPLCSNQDRTPSTTRRLQRCSCQGHHTRGTRHRHQESSTRPHKWSACSCHRTCTQAGKMCRSCVCSPCRQMCRIRPCMWHIGPLRAASAYHHRRIRGTATHHRQRSTQAGIASVSCCRRTRIRQDRSYKCGRVQESELIHKIRSDCPSCVPPAQRAHRPDMCLHMARTPCPARN